MQKDPPPRGLVPRRGEGTFHSSTRAAHVWDEATLSLAGSNAVQGYGYCPKSVKEKKFQKKVSVDWAVCSWADFLGDGQHLPPGNHEDAALWRPSGCSPCNSHTDSNSSGIALRGAGGRLQLNLQSSRHTERDDLSPERSRRLLISLLDPIGVREQKTGSLAYWFACVCAWGFVSYILIFLKKGANVSLASIFQLFFIGHFPTF